MREAQVVGSRLRRAVPVVCAGFALLVPAGMSLGQGEGGATTVRGPSSAGAVVFVRGTRLFELTAGGKVHGLGGPPRHPPGRNGWWSAVHPAWSPDGRRIAVFMARTYGNVDAGGGGWTVDLYVLELPSRQWTLIARNVGDITDALGEDFALADASITTPMWSPDGDSLASGLGPLAVGPGGMLPPSAVHGPSIRLFATGGKRMTLLHTYAQEPAWSPDGRTIAFEPNGCPPPSCAPEGCPSRNASCGISTLPVAGGPVHRLTRVGAEPAWSPSSEKIAYVRRGDIWVMSSDGTGQVRLTRTPKDERRPVWSPDGSRIAYLRCDNACAVFVIRADGRGGAKRLGGTADFRTRISWSPDGETVVFDDGASVIESELAGGRTQRVAEGTQPAWSPVS
jgi:hypothetical protein